MPSEIAPGTPSWLASVNDRAALKLALERGVITRNLLHQETGLSKPTAAQMISRLTEAGLIRSIGPVPGKRGPNPIGYAPDPDNELGVAMDVSEHSIEATLVDVLGTVHPTVKLERTKDAAGRTQEEIAVRETRRALELAAKRGGRTASQVKQLLISVPASVAEGGNLFHLAGSVPPWPTEGLSDLLSQELDKKVTFARDATLAAQAEIHARPNMRTFALLWIGWGLGLSTVFEGQILQGASGRAGEIGYLRPERGEPWEMQGLLGPVALVQLAQQAGMSGDSFESALQKLGTLADRSPNLSKAERAAMGQLADRIAYFASLLVYITDPGTLVIGGPVGAAGGEALADLVQEKIENETGWGLQVQPTLIPEGQVLAGARDLLRDGLISAMLSE